MMVVVGPAPENKQHGITHETMDPKTNLFFAWVVDRIFTELTHSLTFSLILFLSWVLVPVLLVNTLTRSRTTGKDCGYIYNRQECAGLYFEEQGPGFRCPQCSGPRRRYAKKVGDRVGTTLDGGDAPILIFSFGGVAATIAFGIWAVNNL